MQGLDLFSLIDQISLSKKKFKFFNYFNYFYYFFKREEEKEIDEKIILKMRA